MSRKQIADIAKEAGWGAAERNFVRTPDREMYPWRETMNIWGSMGGRRGLGGEM